MAHSHTLPNHCNSILEMLGGLDRNQPRIPTVIGLFKRDSISSTPGSRRGSIQSIHYHNNRLDSPRHSIGSDGSGGPSSGTADAENVVLSTQQHTPQLLSRRGSTFLALSIPEVAEETEKELMEMEAKNEASVGGGRGAIKAAATAAEANKIEEVDNSDDENGNPALEGLAAAAGIAVVDQENKENNNQEADSWASSDNKSNQTHTKL